MNVFDYIQDYVNRSNTGLYGDFLQSNEEDSKVEQLLSGDELLIYRQYKMADRNRSSQVLKIDDLCNSPEKKLKVEIFEEQDKELFITVYSEQ